MTESFFKVSPNRKCESIYSFLKTWLWQGFSTRGPPEVAGGSSGGGQFLTLGWVTTDAGDLFSYLWGGGGNSAQGPRI